MASVASNIQKIIHRHIPLIRFKYGANQSRAGTHPSEHSMHVSGMNQLNDTSSGLKLGHKSPTLEFSQTPKKYRRRLLTQDEIDLVAIGGFK